MRHTDRRSGDVVIDAGSIVPPTAEEIERLQALPDGTPDAESPELGAAFFTRAKPGAPWLNRDPPPGGVG